MKYRIKIETFISQSVFPFLAWSSKMYMGGQGFNWPPQCLREKMQFPNYLCKYLMSLSRFSRWMYCTTFSEEILVRTLWNNPTVHDVHVDTVVTLRISNINGNINTNVKNLFKISAAWLVLNRFFTFVFMFPLMFLIRSHFYIFIFSILCLVQLSLTSSSSSRRTRFRATISWVSRFLALKTVP